jgi:5-formyltetrahydrofolate cyclo-ligase
MDKKQLRQEANRRLAAIDRFYFNESNKCIIANLISLMEYKSAKRIFTYFSVNKEIDTRVLIGGALKSGKQVFIPQALEDGTLCFREYRKDDQLQKGRTGMAEPLDSAPEAKPQSGDIVIVPGLCYDLEGYRLGYGGGFYDRLLADCPALSIGLCRERMLINRVPREEHDVPVDIIVTENRCARP